MVVTTRAALPSVACCVAIKAANATVSMPKLAVAGSDTSGTAESWWAGTEAEASTPGGGMETPVPLAPVWQGPLALPDTVVAGGGDDWLAERVAFAVGAAHFEATIGGGAAPTALVRCSRGASEVAWMVRSWSVVPLVGGSIGWPLGRDAFAAGASVDAQPVAAHGGGSAPMALVRRSREASEAARLARS